MSKEMTLFLAESYDALELSVRSSNIMEDLGVETIGDLVRKTHGEVEGHKHTGPKTMIEISGALAKRGLRLGMFRPLP